MRYLLISVIIFICLGNSFAATQTSDEERPPALDCKSGPLHRTFGKSDWLVYGCSDTRSAVVVTDTGNPATPFYFILWVKPDGSMRLYGEGTGPKEATQAAFGELKLLSSSDVASLVSQAQAAGSSK